MAMTVTEFEADASTLRCSRCGGVGLASERVANNGGILVVCPSCGSRSPLGGALFLKQTATKRPALPHGSSVSDVWARWGNTCFVCGLSQETLAQLGIGRQRHHVRRFCDHGHAGPLVPVCASCHEVVNALQRTVRRFLNPSAAQADSSAEEHHMGA
jgi:hypothetical protein